MFSLSQLVADDAKMFGQGGRAAGRGACPEDVQHHSALLQDLLQPAAL